MNNRADLARNNLDCLRLILASLVALFHLSALTELPAFSFLGSYISPHFAVRGFFVISGLLIYRSYSRSSSLTSYFDKRVRRIYPAYFTVIAIASVVFYSLSKVPAAQYFGLGFWKYLGANLLFLNFLAPTLPGVFTSNPTNVVNGALWTLKIEVAFYLFVPVLHYLCTRFGTKRIIAIVFCLACMWKYGFGFLAAADYTKHMQAIGDYRNLYSKLEVQFPAEMMYFSAGILLLLYFDRLRQHLLAISCITGCLFLLDQCVTRDFLDVFWISGFVFVFGFSRYLGNFSKYGDFSYGVYIVHWPILQTLIAFGLLRLPPLAFLVLSMALIGLAGCLMWTFVESKFLAGSSHYRQVSGHVGSPVLRG